MPLATDTWALELWAEDGLSRDDIRIDVDDQYDTVPDTFQDAVDDAYYDSLVENAQGVLDDGDTPVLGYDGRPVLVEDNTLVYRDGGPVETGWDGRPTLYAERDGGRETVFWDGTTVVSTPRVEEDGIVLESYEGSYAERLAAQDAVDEYDLGDLPLSTNITVVPIVEHDGEDVIPVFYRNGQVAEYPNHYHTVAGGIPDIDMHPVDAGWMEMREEVRVVPEVAANALDDRGIVDSDTLRPDMLADERAVAAAGDDGYDLLFTAPDAMAVTGLVRNLETHTPELCSMVATGLDYEVLVENYTRGAEHTDIEPLPLDADTVVDFVEQHDNVIPVGEAAFLLATEHVTGADVVSRVASEQELESPYDALETRLV